MTEVIDDEHWMSFKENKFLRYNNFISLEMANCIYRYALMASDKAKFLVENKRDYYNEYEHGYFNDPQVAGVWAKYGDTFFDTILEVYRPKIEQNSTTDHRSFRGNI